LSSEPDDKETIMKAFTFATILLMLGMSSLMFAQNAPQGCNMTPKADSLQAHHCQGMQGMPQQPMGPGMDKCPGMPGMGPEMGKGPEMDKQCDMDRGMGDMENLEGMNLTDAQKDQIEKARIDNRKFVNSTTAEIDNLELDLQAALHDQKFQDAVKLSDQISDKRKVLASKRIQMMATVWGILTPDQQKLIKDRKPEMKGCPMMDQKGHHDMKNKPHRERKQKEE
jgi:Spy/CpxP family protein refolding chaperone